MLSAPILLYLHIPKAGGTTLSGCIHWQCQGAGPNKGEEDPDNPGKYLFYRGIYYYPGKGFFKDQDLVVPEHVRRALARQDLRAVLGHFWFGIHEHLPGPAIYATMLRDPVERTVSLYSHLYRQPGTQPHKDDVMTLDEFVANPPYREVDNDQTRRIAGVEPDVGGCTRSTLERAKDNLRRHFRVVGITERFDETLMLFKHTLGWTKNLQYYPQNQTRDRLATATLARSTLEAVRARNELDLELFGFARGLFDEALAAQDAGFREELESFRASQRSFLEDVTRRSAERHGAKAASGVGGAHE